MNCCRTQSRLGVIMVILAIVLAGCGPLKTLRPDRGATAVDPGTGKAIDLGQTEPGPVVCDAIRKQCEDENARRIKALDSCSLQSNTEVRQCKLGCACGPEPGNNADPDQRAERQLCMAHQAACQLQCELDFSHSCDALPRPETCAPPIAATCSRCSDHPTGRVKTCTWPAWPPVHPPGSPLVVPCDQDWSWAGTGACSACRTQAVNTPQLGKQTCQCQYPAPQPAGPVWTNTCHTASTLPVLQR